MKSHVNELGDCSGELSCRLIPTRGGQESKWIQKDLSLRSMAVFSGALQFCREHDWAPGRKNASLRSRRLGYAGYKNARERGAISSRFLCPSLPADVLWGSFVTHSFLLCGELSGEATSALVPPGPARLYLLFPLNQNRQTKQARKKPLLPECFERVPRFLRTFSSKWESCGPIYFLRWGGRRAASPSVGVCQLL